MRAAAFFRKVTMDTAGFFDDLLAALARENIAYCLIGGQAVNAYVEPLVSLDVDIAVATADLTRVRELMRRLFDVTEFAHSINVSAPGSSLRAQIQTDPRYGEFVRRSEEREVLGTKVRVAALEDVLQGKIWAASDPERRGSKRQKDLADIARIIERFPELRSRVPDGILGRLET